MGSLRCGGPVCCQQQFPCLGAGLLTKTGNVRISRSVPLVCKNDDGSKKLRGMMLSVEDLPSNAFRRKNEPKWRGGFSLGVDLGLVRTGIAISKGFTVRPLMVLEMRGQKLELRLLEIAEREEVDEFIVGLPRSSDSKETPQSNKVRSVAGRLAARAAERCLMQLIRENDPTFTVFRIEIREFLLLVSSTLLDVGIDKFVTFQRLEACDPRKLAESFRGLDKETRPKQIDAYAAVMVLERYFSMSGSGTELVVPKQLDLQDKLRKGPPKDIDFYPDE